MGRLRDGLTVRQGEVLELIKELIKEGLEVIIKLLAERLNISESAVYGHVNKLADKGLVEFNGERGRRVIRLFKNSK